MLGFCERQLDCFVFLYESENSSIFLAANKAKVQRRSTNFGVELEVLISKFQVLFTVKKDFTKNKFIKGTLQIGRC